MSKVHLSMSMSADGYVAGPDQSEENPLGIGGLAVHQWHFDEPGEHPVNKEIADAITAGKGATIMGRNMYGPIRGEWGDRDWRGWWGDDPPYHNPTYVLTHHEHEPIEMEGGTTFYFVTDGIESAFEQAREAAGDKDISIAGGASVANQYLAAGLVDEIDVQISPILLGGGERLFEGVDPGELNLEIEHVLEAPQAAHIRYRVKK
jgi:dihydrofolate reductase